MKGAITPNSSPVSYTHLIIAYLLLLSFTSCTRVQNGKGDAAIEQKIEALLSRMTLEEKIGDVYKRQVLQFVRSGRVAITTSCFERVNEYLTQREEKYRQQKTE